MKEQITENSAKWAIDWFVANETILRNAASGTTTFDQWSRNMSSWTFDTIVRHLVQHKLCLEPAPTYRPYNREECENLVWDRAAFREKVTGSVLCVRQYEPINDTLLIGSNWYDAHDILKTFELRDGSPCGVKEGDS